MVAVHSSNRNTPDSSIRWNIGSYFVGLRGWGIHDEPLLLPLMFLKEWGQETYIHRVLGVCGQQITYTATWGLGALGWRAGGLS